MSFPRCFLPITSTTIEDADKLDIRCTDRCGPNKCFISVRGYFKSPVIFSPEDPLDVAFIDPAHKNILVNIDADTKLHSILQSIQAKCIASSPDPSKTQPFLKQSSDGRVQIRLKTQFSKWKDENGTLISTDEALADHRIVLKTWIIEMYRLWRQRDGTWHVVWALNNGRVAPAKQEPEESAGDELDSIEW